MFAAWLQAQADGAGAPAQIPAAPATGDAPACGVALDA